MKTFALAFFATLTLTAARADIIANGDFHDGKANWKGDLRAASEQDSYDTSSIDHPSDATGVIVNLKGSWTKIYQTFNSRDKSLAYSITYKTSADYAPTAAGNRFHPQPPPVPPGANRTGPPNQFLFAILHDSYVCDLQPPTGNDFLLLVLDLTSSTYSSALIHPTPGSTDLQTATGVLTSVPPHDEKVFYLIFSPGKGSVTLSKVALTPVADTAAP